MLITSLIASNAIATFVAAALGGLFYLLVCRIPVVLVVLGFAVSILIAISFAFDIGEAYSYAALMKRAFWHFGDDVTTWLTPIFVWAVLSHRRVLAVAVACGIAFSGTKIALLLLLVQVAITLYLFPSELRTMVGRFLRPAAAAAVAFVFLVLASPGLITIANAVLPESSHFSRTSAGAGSCESVHSCVAGQLAAPLRDRLLSGAAGLWMTLEGGFPGSRYPNTGEKFADLMMETNPFGLNSTLGLDHETWRRVGTVQTPYLHIGAGYGPVVLTLLLAAIVAVCLMGVSNIRAGERDPALAFTLFFIVNAVVNQTQPWLNVGPVLLAMAFCGTHILLRYGHRRLSEARIAIRGA